MILPIIVINWCPICTTVAVWSKYYLDGSDSAGTLLQADICQFYAGSQLSIRFNFRLAKNIYLSNDVLRVCSAFDIFFQLPVLIWCFLLCLLYLHWVFIFDSLWDYFLEMIYCCCKLNLVPVIIVTKWCPILYWWQHDGNIT